MIFDICSKRIYEKDGVKKIKFHKAGIMKTTNDGHSYIRFFHQPDVDFYVFEKTPPIPIISAED
ncbi:MAG: hypothetical protein WC223_11090 [Bacteroidales bacterium]|jgi:hypothetical protein